MQNLAIVDIQSSPNEQLDQFIRGYPLTKICYVQADITDETVLRTTFNRINEIFESIDVLINAAGVFNDRNIEQTFKVNVVIQTSNFSCCAQMLISASQF